MSLRSWYVWYYAWQDTVSRVKKLIIWQLILLVKATLPSTRLHWLMASIYFPKIWFGRFVTMALRCPWKKRKTTTENCIHVPRKFPIWNAFQIVKFALTLILFLSFQWKRKEICMIVDESAAVQSLNKGKKSKARDTAAVGKWQKAKDIQRGEGKERRTKERKIEMLHQWRTRGKWVSLWINSFHGNQVIVTVVTLIF